MTTQLHVLRRLAQSGLPKLMAGKGTVLAAGTRSAKVTYELLLGGSPRRVIAHGTLYARFSALERMGHKPGVTLRLANGHRLGISITEMKSAKASFEVISEPVY